MGTEQGTGELEMLRRRHWGLLASAAVFAAGTASAQQVDIDTAKVEQMQRQMQQLQEQMKQVNKELADAKKKAAEAKAEIPAAFNGAYGADLKPFPAKAPSILDKVKLTWGGYFSADAVWREHSTLNDSNTSFSAIPYPFSPLYGENEFRASARQSRISLLVEGPLTPTQKLSGYFEMDFQGAAPTANFNQSNSWTPRLRQGFFAYDNLDSGFHFLAGQAWSLVTQTTVDMTPRKENAPITIDAGYIPGFDYTRNWQVRFVQDIAPWISVGASVEAPAALVNTQTGTIGNFGSANGWIVNFTNTPGNGTLNNGTGSFTADNIPDVIAKVALDPGWGHYEAFGIARFFNDNVFYCPANDISTVGVCATTGVGSSNPASSTQKTTVGEGVGGSVLLPVIPKYLDVTASTMYGRGIGRYGASQLSDVYVGADGSLQTITAFHGLVGAILHPWAGLDIYGYGGIEKEASAVWANLAGTGGVSGFGVPNVVNAGCYITTAASFTGGTSNCAAVNKLVSGATLGFWQDVYKGPMGRVATGLQWEWIHRESFAGYGVVAASTTGPALAGVGAVHTDDNMVLASVRWYPF
jgi:outer membrane murein-binding lipoprotein Lpp